VVEARARFPKVWSGVWNWGVEVWGVRCWRPGLASQRCGGVAVSARAVMVNMVHASDGTPSSQWELMQCMVK
jgi:hypothetical protein